MIDNRRRTVNILIAAMLLVMSAIIVLKVTMFNYTFDSIIPGTGYRVHTWMTFTGNGDDVLVKTYLPISGKRQNVANEQINSPEMEYRKHVSTLHGYGEWTRYKADKPLKIDIYYDVRISPIEYEIDQLITIEQNRDESLDRYLGETDAVQVNDPYLLELGNRLAGNEIYTLNALEAIYGYIYEM